MPTPNTPPNPAGAAPAVVQLSTEQLDAGVALAAALAAGSTPDARKDQLLAKAMGKPGQPAAALSSDENEELYSLLGGKVPVSEFRKSGVYSPSDQLIKAVPVLKELTGGMERGLEGLVGALEKSDVRRGEANLAVAKLAISTASLLKELVGVVKALDTKIDGMSKALTTASFPGGLPTAAQPPAGRVGAGLSIVPAPVPAAGQAPGGGGQLTKGEAIRRLENYLFTKGALGPNGEDVVGMLGDLNMSGGVDARQAQFIVTLPAAGAAASA